MFVDLARPAGVLAGQRIDLAQHAQGAGADVLEIADRRADQEQGGRSRHLSCLPCDLVP